ncbi:DUF188 domain-containing protein [Oscillospiraceae bacterium OttesenSCG-928-G22]|nr:DUF188 domain-containing protein [Oscillospiraceae bacterium OttesenSCG-928-G22]
MTILIDADGCPVVDTTIHLAVEYGCECILVCDTSHEFQRKGARTVTVSKGADSVDFMLVNMVLPGDIVVTQDYALAAMCLARKAIPIRQDGLVYTDNNIDALLHERHTSRKIRMGGGRLKGGTKRTAAEDVAFEASLRSLLTQGTE